MFLEDWVFFKDGCWFNFIVAIAAIFGHASINHLLGWSCMWHHAKLLTGPDWLSWKWHLLLSAADLGLFFLINVLTTHLHVLTQMHQWLGILVHFSQLLIEVGLSVCVPERFAAYTPKEGAWAASWSHEHGSHHERWLWVRAPHAGGTVLIENPLEHIFVLCYFPLLI